MTEKEAKGFLTSAYDLLEKDNFWLHQSDGLAVFIGNDFFEYYETPIKFETKVYVNHHFYLRPLLPLLNKDHRFFLLALSQGEVRFFEGQKYSITPVKIKDLTPANFAEAMAVEDPEKTLQAHGAGNSTVHHGHGLHKDQQDWQLEQYCRMVDDGLMKMLHDEKAPLIIAGVDELVAIYKNISRYNYIVEPHVSGNVENDDPVLLHEKAWRKIVPVFNQKIEKKKSEFKTAMANGKASSKLLDIVPKAINGKVETLFLTKHAPVVWGNYVESTNTIDAHSKRNNSSVCLVNLAAVKTIEQGGKIYELDHMELPAFTEMANAIYRY